MTGGPLARDDTEFRALVGEWLRKEVADLPDGGALPADLRAGVHDRLPTLPQRRRRWPFSWFPGGIRTRHPGEPGSTQADRRSKLVFAPIAVAGVLAAATLGGAVLFSAPTAPPASTAPAEGLTGSVWVAHRADRPDVYLVVHPDGSLVASIDRVATIKEGLGLGVWEPTGDHTLVGTLRFGSGDTLDAQRSGSSLYHLEGSVDDAGETATLAYTGASVRGTGEAQPETSGTLQLERLHMLPMPADARAETPAEAGWSLARGPALHGKGSGTVMSVAPEHAADPSAYVIDHADGTSFGASPYGGMALALWAPAGEDTLLRTAWGGTWPAHEVAVSVDQVTPAGSAFDVAYGTSDAFEGTYQAEPACLYPMSDSEPLPEPDPALWPDEAMVWTEELADGGVATTAYFPDGSVVTSHPTYGVGVGLWQPIDDATFAIWIAYATERSFKWRLRGEGTLGPDGQTLSMDYLLQNLNWTTDPEPGTSTATRMRAAG
jgi:hypothetical protein